MKKLFALIICLMTGIITEAQVLKFNAQGNFKILQFTDVHYRYNDPMSDVALKCIQEVTESEKPDLLVFTGDNIYSKPGDVAMQTLLKTISKTGVPFVVLFGNHDEVQGVSNSDLYDIIRTAKNNIQPDKKGNVSPDYTIEIRSSKDHHIAAILYCLDSHNRAKTQCDREKGYAWLTYDQINWYRKVSASYTESNNGNPLPALAFFHIPVPEFNEAASDEEDILIGNRLEKACAPKLNTGMFTAMRIGGDVMGIFCGHDHDNDYTVMHHGILLGYGRFTGGNTEYNHLRNGGRVILLKEGQRTFDTWIHLRGGEIINKTTFPNSYIKDDWKTRTLEQVNR